MSTSAILLAALQLAAVWHQLTCQLDANWCEALFDEARRATTVGFSRTYGWQLVIVILRFGWI